MIPSAAPSTSNYARDTIMTRLSLDRLERVSCLPLPGDADRRRLNLRG